MMILMLVAAYLIGSLPAGLIITRRVAGVDVRRYGSGNIGMANVARVAGWKAGAVVLLVDAAKGVIPVLAATRLGAPPLWVAFAGMAAVIGHNWSAFLKGRGGKGVATTLGVLAVIAPLTVPVLAGVWLVMVALTRYSSVGSLTGLSLMPFLIWAFGYAQEAVLFGALAALLGIYQHRSNLVRLLQGRENKITLRSGRPS